jgi:hypothetical protein
MFDDAINKTTEGLIDETPRETPETIIESETKGLELEGLSMNQLCDKPWAKRYIKDGSYRRSKENRSG